MASSTAGARKRKWGQQNGGYEHEFVSTIPSRYICSICANVLRDAHLTACCGQHFCASCLTNWLGTQQKRKTCPHCRQKNFQHMANKERIREVNELKIHCANHQEGCGWVGELGELKSHLDSDQGCGYVEVTCSNRECMEEVMRKDLQSHEQEKCCYRRSVCRFCGYKDTYNAIISQHYPECPEYPLDCPNRCGVTGIVRKAMTDHHSSCPLEPLDCPFKDVGCTGKIACKDMEDHMTANQQKHILQSLHSLHRSNEEIKQSLQKTRHELQDLRVSAVGLDAIGATLTFRVTDFPQLRKKKKTWYSPPFKIVDKVRVRLKVYPSGFGKGQGTHVSLSLKLIEDLKEETKYGLAYSVSISAMQGQTPDVTKTMELCTFKEDTFVSDEDEFEEYDTCSFNMPFPSTGRALQSEVKFSKVKDITSLLVDDSLILQLKLLRHHHESCLWAT